MFDEQTPTDPGNEMTTQYWHYGDIRRKWRKQITWHQFGGNDNRYSFHKTEAKDFFYFLNTIFALLLHCT